MRCNICNKILEKYEVKIDPITNRWSPCAKCNSASYQAAETHDLDPEYAEALLLWEDADEQ